jgi:zinc/manganese transport system substrate-binding protein
MWPLGHTVLIHFKEVIMKQIIVFLTLVFVFQISSAGQINIVTTYGYIADIVQRIGKGHVEVTSLARGDYNPHLIIPKPSYIAKMRKADLLIINGCQLEIGWLPPILSQANNGNVQPGERGFLDLSTHVHLIDVPSSVSRELGDVHPEGNPHFYLDPKNIPIIAQAISSKLCEIDPDHSAAYQANTVEFSKIWEQKMKEWNEKMKFLKDAKIIEYHKVFDYFLHSYEFVIAGTIEPLPGIPPTTKHIGEVERLVERENVKYIFQDVYNPQDASQYLSKKLDIKMIILPHDVGAVKEADNIISLFDELTRRITQ